MKLYKIIQTSEIDNIDFTILDQERETVRYSLDGNMFIISSDIFEEDITTKTLEEMCVIVNNPEWTNQ